MMEELKKVRNARIIVGITQTAFFLLVLSMKGLSVLTILFGSLPIISFLAACKTHKELIKNDNN
ncbi:MAG: hypothetical protein GX300_10230 [Tissierellia bacterium]|nr:hypothetical protein [Tissierellia bacterium]